MKLYQCYVLSLINLFSISACNRSPRTTEVAPNPVRNDTKQPTSEDPNTIQPTEEITPPPSDTNGSIIVDDVIQIQQPKYCFDESGKEMTTQFQDIAKNPPSNRTADCFDRAGALLYKGTARNCLEEMQARFGPDIIFPTQRVFPKQYEAARAQGANGQSALKSTLSSGTCKDLKSKE